MKPVSASDILRKHTPRDFIGKSGNYLHPNRWESLRDVSPSSSIRSRSDSVVSVKRKTWEEDALDETIQAHSKVSRLDEEEIEKTTLLESRISKVNHSCGKLISMIQQLDSDDALKCVLSDIVQSLKETNEIQDELLVRQKSYRQVNDAQSYSSHQVDRPAAEKLSYSNVAAGKSAGNNPRKRLAGGLVNMNSDSRGNPSSKETPPAESEEEKKVRRFTEAIRDAERSTLCFNLDMGNVPLMNKAIIADKASLALTKMAARKEGKFTSIPSPDSVAALDDMTSLVTNMEFYGSCTKQYTGKSDATFCTIPVKYQFKDRDQKAFAEKTLRD
jgi:hypothetical protein